MRRSTAALSILVLGAVGCGAAPDADRAPAEGAVSSAGPAIPAEGFDWDRSIGVAVADGEGLCLRIRAGGLAVGTRVLLVSPGSEPIAIEATVEEAREDACPGEAGATSHASYRLSARTPASPGELWIALVEAPPGMAERSPIRLDLDRDGRAEEFRACTSAEGVHLTVWTGPPPDGARRWHAYHYLGYDVEPSCTASETEPAGQEGDHETG